MIGIIGALHEEVAALKNAAQQTQEKTVSGVTYIIGKIAGRDCVIAQCGIGKVNAAVCAQTMILHFAPAAIINCGIAGALRPGLQVGDIIIGKDVVQYDMDTTVFGDRPGLLEIGAESLVEIPCDQQLCGQLCRVCAEIHAGHTALGRIATGDRFVSEKEDRLHIAKAFGADACEMEGGAIGHVCRLNHVPFAVLRSISDSMEQNGAVDYLCFKQQAAQAASNIITAFLERKPL